MLLHSYGGAVGTEAVKGLWASERASKGLSGGVIHLIYMCGFMLQVGESVGGASLPRPIPDPVEIDEATGTTFLCEPPIPLFFADVEAERAKKDANTARPPKRPGHDRRCHVPRLAAHSHHLFADAGRPDVIPGLAGKAD